MRTIVSACILFACINASAQHGGAELKKALHALQNMYSVHFIYDASLADTRADGTLLKNSSLADNLNHVFGKTNIRWEIHGESVLLFREAQYTLSGHVS